VLVSGLDAVASLHGARLRIREGRARTDSRRDRCADRPRNGCRSGPFVHTQGHPILGLGRRDMSGETARGSTSGGGDSSNAYGNVLADARIERLVRSLARWRLIFLVLAVCLPAGCYGLCERQARRLDALGQHGEPITARVTDVNSEGTVFYAYVI